MTPREFRMASGLRCAASGSAGVTGERRGVVVPERVPERTWRVVAGGRADTLRKGVTEPTGKPRLSRAQRCIGSWWPSRRAVQAAQVARSERMTPPGTSATYTGSTLVSEVRAWTGAWL